MSLTLIIPSHNDTESLCHLLQRADRLDFADQLIIVDDGSDVPLNEDQLRAAGAPGPGQLTLLRNDTPQGPGLARNRALLHVVTDHLLFLDADDLPARELPDLLRDLEGEEFDFCQFQYHDTRMEQERAWGQMPHDQQLWQAAGLALGALNEVPPRAAAKLSRTANYPWNKLYRTEFLRSHAIGCSEILVHEDVELHWRSFLNAQRILASDRVGVIHFVSSEGERLTNRTGAERLDLFGPLDRLAAEALAKSPDLYAPAFFSFALGLFDWIAGNLDPAYHDALAEKTRAFIAGRIPPALLEQIADDDPMRTARVLARAGLG
jgi:glycosyltransferase involved in cell wall biosynthesis